MNGLFLVLGLGFAGFAALVHVYIFYLESLAFETAGRKAFGVAQEDVRAMKPWALNQGFYNLFLALGMILGLIRQILGDHVGLSLVDVFNWIMIGAALVLVISDRSKAKGALVQGLFPVLSMICLTVHALF